MLSFRMDFRVFLWNSARGSIWADLSANDESPDLVIGLVYVLYMYPEEADQM